MLTKHCAATAYQLLENHGAEGSWKGTALISNYLIESICVPSLLLGALLYANTPLIPQNIDHAGKSWM